MKKNNFFYLLLGASFSAFKFAEQLVLDKLTPEFRYNVHLNMSNDDDSPKFDVHKEDNNKKLTELTMNEVVDLLYRSDKLPVWIDISVFSTNSNYTTLQLLCAGRYSSDENEFYYRNQGSGMFGVKGPELPLNYINGVKFSLNRITG